MIVSVTRVSANKVKVELTGSSGNPLIPSPFIDWCYTITIDTAEDPPTYTIQGGNDNFPAYDVYVNDQEIHKFNPSENNPFLLVGNCGDVLVPLTSGSLE